MGFFPEEAPLSTYILNLINHHGWQEFASPMFMQPSIVRNFYDGQIDEEEDMVRVHGCKVLFNAREINSLFKLRDNPDVEGNQLIASSSNEQMQDTI